MKRIVWIIYVLISLILLLTIDNVSGNNITDYHSIVQQIISTAKTNEQGYQRLTQLCNEFGPRLSGSSSLEDAIDWIISTMESQDKFDSIIAEDVLVPTVFIFFFS